MSATNACTNCPAGGGGGPTGDCTPEQHRSLQDVVDANCKSGKSACNSQQDCAKLLENLGKNQSCLDARNNINAICFGGGDADHNASSQVMKDTLAAVAKCTTIYNQKCRPQPTPVPDPVPSPAEDPDFMAKMSRLTGLTGAALALYLIISEGSRLFPPRNLVPIP